MTSRELVYQTLSFQNSSGRIPKQMWHLPWASIHYPIELKKILDDFTWDIDGAPAEYAQPPTIVGDPYKVGRYVDEWGCRFHTIQEGVFGEVEEPIVKNEDWSDSDSVRIPKELLTFDLDAVNRFCAQSDRFILAGVTPRPFEQLQFMRGSENLFIDLADPPRQMLEFLKKMHDFYCQLVEKWAKTDVDAINLMDDWGSQTSLLINPTMWVEIFKPLYRDYIEIAASHGKKTFMHSDGHTLSIIPHLIDIGLDAFNTQIFCIGIENLAPYRGKITFWGEMDRQYLLTTATLSEVDKAVDLVYDTLWDNGGCIAQCEFGPLGNPDNVRRTYERWAQKV